MKLTKNQIHKRLKKRVFLNFFLIRNFLKNKMGQKFEFFSNL